MQNPACFIVSINLYIQKSFLPSVKINEYYILIFAKGKLTAGNLKYFLFSEQRTYYVRGGIPALTIRAIFAIVAKPGNSPCGLVCISMHMAIFLANALYCPKKRQIVVHQCFLVFLNNKSASGMHRPNVATSKIHAGSFHKKFNRVGYISESKSLFCFYKKAFFKHFVPHLKFQYLALFK